MAQGGVSGTVRARQPPCGIIAKRLTGANGDRGGHPDEAALHPGGETANASKPLKITVEAAIRRPQLRRLG